MDEFARLPNNERRLYFEQAAAKKNLSSQIIEKDFWVCWSLRRLFSLDEFCNHLTFKGGTSLSKVYGAIERFSEDVDIAIEREFLGFGGEKEPEKGGSAKEQQRRIEKLKEACQHAVADRLKPQLHKAVKSALAGNADWTLKLDPADPDRQTLLFRYPPAIKGELSTYFAASVKIEFGARSDHYPVERASITPYLSDSFQDLLVDNTIKVRVLSAARTFWEKATILHMLHHFPENKKIAPRMSRHYYDLYQLSLGEVYEQALKAIDLLERVSIFKSIFFKAAWAKYEDARMGKLRLYPSEKTTQTLRQDYKDMEPMFFHDPPTFDEILERLPKLENRINNIKG